MALGNVVRDTSEHFKIDGQAVPSPGRDGTAFKDIIISRSWDDMHGIFVDKILRYRKQITWTYKAMSEEALRGFYTEYIMNHIRNNKERNFMVTTPYPGQDVITVNCYLGTPIEFRPVHSTKYRGIVYWEFSLVWTEIEGESLDGGVVSE